MTAQAPIASLGPVIPCRWTPGSPTTRKGVRTSLTALLVWCGDPPSAPDQASVLIEQATGAFSAMPPVPGR